MQMQWIPVEAGLPQTTKTISWYIVNTGRGVGIAEFNPIHGFSRIVIVGNTHYSGTDITHWMALPPPPCSD